MRIFGVILAGGAGRRMGGADKALLPLGGQPLLEHVLNRLRPQVDSVALSANGDPARFAGFELPVLADHAPMGPLSGLLCGLRWAAAQGADAVATVPVDVPFLPRDLVARFLAAKAQGAVFATSAGRVHSVTAVWPVALAAPLAAFLGSGVKPKAMDFAAVQGAVAVDFPDPSAFLNLNTREDLAWAEAALAKREKDLT